MLRGAPISDEERKELNLEAGRLIKDLGIYMELRDSVYDELREEDFVGYAEYYLQESWDETEFVNKADVAVYKQLLEIDSKLGTTQSEQLRRCLRYSPRMQLIEV